MGFVQSSYFVQVAVCQQTVSNTGFTQEKYDKDLGIYEFHNSSKHKNKFF
jgi:hypothetical protein